MAEEAEEAEDRFSLSSQEVGEGNGFGAFCGEAKDHDLPSGTSEVMSRMVQGSWRLVFNLFAFYVKWPSGEVPAYIGWSKWWLLCWAL